MKTVSKLIAVSALALAAAAPVAAVAQEIYDVPEANTLIERNTYLYTQDKRAIAGHQNAGLVRSHGGAEAFAFAPVNSRQRDFGQADSQ
jgi:hypothetical protein